MDFIFVQNGLAQKNGMIILLIAVEILNKSLQTKKWHVIFIYCNDFFVLFLIQFCMCTILSLVVHNKVEGKKLFGSILKGSPLDLKDFFFPNKYQCWSVTLSMF